MQLYFNACKHSLCVGVYSDYLAGLKSAHLKNEQWPGDVMILNVYGMHTSMRTCDGQ